MMNKRAIKFIIRSLIIIVILIIGYYFLIYKRSNNLGNVTNSYEYHTAIFVANGAKISDNKINCVVVGNSCEITLPNISNDDGYVLGWNDTNSNIAKYNVGETINISKDSVFYAITYKKYTLNIDDSNVYYVGENKLSCNVYNNNNSCSVTLPNFNALGYENRGYSTVKNALVGVIYPNSSYVLTNNTTLYPIYNTLTRRKTIDVLETLYGYNSIIEIERGCDEKTKNKYLTYIENINNKAGYLLIGSKITFLKEDTFDQIWGSNYAGMNYGPSPFRMFDIKCNESILNDYYGTMVHELAHTWDFNYSNYNDKNISDENDFINLFTKYKNLKNRPFRDYSYSNIREFLADSYKYYYFKYIDVNNYYQKLDYPSDIKKVLDKYICITENNYDSNLCR